MLSLSLSFSFFLFSFFKEKKKQDSYYNHGIFRVKYRALLHSTSNISIFFPFFFFLKTNKIYLSILWAISNINCGLCGFAHTTHLFCPYYRDLSLVHVSWIFASYSKDPRPCILTSCSFVHTLRNHAMNLCFLLKGTSSMLISCTFVPTPGTPLSVLVPLHYTAHHRWL